MDELKGKKEWKEERMKGERREEKESGRMDRLKVE